MKAIFVSLIRLRKRLFAHVGKCVWYGEPSNVWLICSHVWIGYSQVRHRLMIEIIFD